MENSTVVSVIFYKTDRTRQYISVSNYAQKVVKEALPGITRREFTEKLSVKVKELVEELGFKDLPIHIYT